MKLISCAILVLLYTSLSKQEEEDPYPACHGDFEPTEELCNRFDFKSSQELVEEGCINPTNGTTFYDLSGLPNVSSIASNTIKMSSLITNVFEDSEPNFAFASCSDIGDKRGYTAGYAGFTTGTGDAETLIQDYKEVSPGNSLEKYLDQLATISALPQCDRDSRGSTQGLDGFCDSWKSEACNTNHKFSDLQRQWVYQNYMLPSARYAAQNGVQSELGKAIFYDTIIQHGFQYTEPDINIVRIINLTGPRKTNESEQTYLSRFLTTRRKFQCCYPDTVWPASGTRSADLMTLVSNYDENKDLNPPIKLEYFERTITGNEDLTKDVKRC